MRPPIKLFLISLAAAFTSKYKAQSTLILPMPKVSIPFSAWLPADTLSLQCSRRRPRALKHFSHLRCPLSHTNSGFALFSNSYLLLSILHLSLRCRSLMYVPPFAPRTMHYHCYIDHVALRKDAPFSDVDHNGVFSDVRTSVTACSNSDVTRSPLVSPPRSEALICAQ